MTPSDHDVADALAAAARTMNASHTLAETLDSIVHAARTSVPGFDEVGISVVEGKGRIETRAATGELVRELDRLQYDLGEGPCLDAIRVRPVVVAEDLAHESASWPRYAPRATAAGVRAQMGLRLHVDGETLGGLNLYSRSSGVDPDAVHVAALFATHAALALGRTRREVQLADALETRSMIGTAIGLVMARYRITEQQAFQFLARASSTSNIKLRDIASEIVWSTDEQHGAAARSDEQ